MLTQENDCFSAQSHALDWIKLMSINLEPRPVIICSYIQFATRSPWFKAVNSIIGADLLRKWNHF